jgi:hypothetical protein
MMQLSDELDAIIGTPQYTACVCNEPAGGF